MILEIAELPRLQTNGYGSWRARYSEKERWHKLVWHAVLVAGRPEAPLDRAVVTMTRHSTRQPDSDNLVASFKPVLDGLKHARVIVDDKPENIGMPTYIWQKSKQKDQRIVVRVEGIE